jgi:hypothetical protein
MIDFIFYLQDKIKVIINIIFEYFLIFNIYFLIFNIYFFNFLYNFYIENKLLFSILLVVFNDLNIKKNINNILKIFYIFILKIFSILIYYFIFFYELSKYFFLKKDIYVNFLFFVLSINNIIKLKIIYKYKINNKLLYWIYYFIVLFELYKSEYILFIRLNFKKFKNFFRSLKNNLNFYIIKFFLKNKMQIFEIFVRINIFKRIKKINYHRLRMRASYLKSQLWYDWMNYYNRLKYKKKKYKYFFFFYMDKLNFYVLKKKGYIIICHIYIYIKKFVSILICIRDSERIPKFLKFIAKRKW